MHRKSERQDERGGDDDCRAGNHHDQVQRVIVKHADGRPLHRVGPLPYVEVSPAIREIQEDRDEALERALKYVQCELWRCLMMARLLYLDRRSHFHRYGAAVVASLRDVVVVEEPRRTDSFDLRYLRGRLLRSDEIANREGSRL